MKSATSLVFAFLFITATAASAQAPAAGGGQTIGLAAGLQRSYAGVKANLTEAAAKLADADYTYRPSPESMAACVRSRTNDICAAIICQRPSCFIQTFVARYRRDTFMAGPLTFTTNR